MPASSLAMPAVMTIPTSFEEAYRDYAVRAARWARSLGGSAIDVEDVVQEVFLVVSRRLREFRGDASFSTWLFEVTRKIVANHRRRHRWRFWGSSETEVSAARGTDPLVELERRRALDIFYQALDRLPEKYRTVLVLFEIEGLSTQEIAELRGLKLATVKVQLFRAREAFVAHYQQLLDKAKP